MDYLDEKTDRTPFSYKKEVIEKFIVMIEANKNKINEYLEQHPSLTEALYDVEQEIVQETLSYMSLEDDEGQIDIKPSRLQNSIEKRVDAKKMDRAHAYKDACMFIHEQAIKSDAYLDQNILIKAHYKLYTKSELGAGTEYWRFRNEKDVGVDIMNAKFDAVPGELVSCRIQNLFYMLSNDWFEDHPIIKGVKFLSEYFRIQPHNDGNKRTGIMAMNFILESNGYPRICILKNQKSQFFEGLEEAVLGRDVTKLALIAAQNVLNRQEVCIEKIKKYRLMKYEESLKELNFEQSNCE